MHDLLPGEAQRGQDNHWRPHKPRKVTPEFVLRAEVPGPKREELRGSASWGGLGPCWAP